MIKKELLKEIKKRCPPLDYPVLQELLSHLDRDYLSDCDAPEIAEHIEISLSLTPAYPAHLRVARITEDCYKIIVIAFDYFSEFSIICGLLSSFGLNIEGGNVQTLSINYGRKKIVDVFHVRNLGKKTFDLSRQERFKEELEVLISMLEKGLFREARSKVNRGLIAHISQMQEKTEVDQKPLMGLLAPIHIQFDNKRSPHWTILGIEGYDTPAFLYALSNALAMRNIYIHKIKIYHREDEIHDRLYISKRQGNKITKENDIKALKVCAILIKQFIHYLCLAPDPMMAITHFDQFLDKILETENSRPLIGLLQQKKTMDLLARFFGTSNFLWEDFLRIRFKTLFPILEKFSHKKLDIGKNTLQRRLGNRLRNSPGFETKQKILNDFKDEEMFRIDLSHLHEPRGKLISFSETLSDLAEVVIATSYRICSSVLEEKHGVPRLKNGKRVPCTIFGFGKFGGRELGYASDVELLFVYGGSGQSDGSYPMSSNLYFEKLTQEIIRFIKARQEGIFHIDMRLRPYGKSGPWATSLHQFETYYSQKGKALPFERQALIKLRKVAGSRALGRKCETARDRFVYSGVPWDLEEARHIRMRQVDELVPKGRVNVKYSNGGVVDIEYLVQYLQIIYGKENTALRTPNTLEGLSVLSKHEIISRETAQTLKKIYLFLRSLIDSLRMVRGNARDLLLPDPSSDEFVFLSRRMGFTSQDWHHGSKQLEKAVSYNMSEAHKHYKNLFTPGV